MPSHTTSGTVNTGGGIGDTALQRATASLAGSPWAFTPYGRERAEKVTQENSGLVSAFGGADAFKKALLDAAQAIYGATTPQQQGDMKDYLLRSVGLDPKTVQPWQSQALLDLINPAFYSNPDAAPATPSGTDWSSVAGGPPTAAEQAQINELISTPGSGYNELSALTKIRTDAGYAANVSAIRAANEAAVGGTTGTATPQTSLQRIEQGIGGGTLNASLIQNIQNTESALGRPLNDEEITRIIREPWATKDWLVQFMGSGARRAEEGIAGGTLNAPLVQNIQDAERRLGRTLTAAEVDEIVNAPWETKDTVVKRYGRATETAPSGVPNERETRATAAAQRAVDAGGSLREMVAAIKAANDAYDAEAAGRAAGEAQGAPGLLGDAARIVKNVASTLGEYSGVAEKIGMVLVGFGVPQAVIPTLLAGAINRLRSGGDPRSTLDNMMAQSGLTSGTREYEDLRSKLFAELEAANSAPVVEPPPVVAPPTSVPDAADTDREARGTIAQPGQEGPATADPKAGDRFTDRNGITWEWTPPSTRTELVPIYEVGPASDSPSQRRDAQGNQQWEVKTTRVQGRWTSLGKIPSYITDTGTEDVTLPPDAGEEPLNPPVDDGGSVDGGGSGPPETDTVEPPPFEQGPATGPPESETVEQVPVPEGVDADLDAFVQWLEARSKNALPGVKLGDVAAWVNSIGGGAGEAPTDNYSADVREVIDALKEWASGDIPEGLTGDTDTMTALRGVLNRMMGIGGAATVQNTLVQRLVGRLGEALDFDVELPAEDARLTEAIDRAADGGATGETPAVDTAVADIEAPTVTAPQVTPASTADVTAAGESLAGFTPDTASTDVTAATINMPSAEELRGLIAELRGFLPQGADTTVEGATIGTPSAETLQGLIAALEGFLPQGADTTVEGATIATPSAESWESLIASLRGFLPDAADTTVAGPTGNEFIERVAGADTSLSQGTFGGAAAGLAEWLARRPQSSIQQIEQGIAGGALNMPLVQNIQRAEQALGRPFNDYEIQRIINEPWETKDALVREMTQFATENPSLERQAQTSLQETLRQLQALASGQVTPEMAAAQDAQLAMVNRGAKAELAQDPFNTGARGITGSPAAYALAARYRNQQRASTVDQLTQQRFAAQQSALQQLPQIQAQLAQQGIARQGAETAQLGAQTGLLNTLLGASGEEARMNLEKLATAGGLTQDQAALQSRANELSAQLRVSQAEAMNLAKLEALSEAGRQAGTLYGERQRTATTQAELTQRAAEISAQLRVSQAEAMTLAKLEALSQATSTQATLFGEQQRAATSQAELTQRAAEISTQLGVSQAEAMNLAKLEALSRATTAQTALFGEERAGATAQAELTQRASEISTQLGVDQAQATTLARLEADKATAELAATVMSRLQDTNDLMARLKLEADTTTAEGRLATDRLLLEAALEQDRLRQDAAKAERDGDLELARILSDRASDLEQASLQKASLQLEALKLEGATETQTTEQLLQLLETLSSRGMEAAGQLTEAEQADRDREAELRRTGMTVVAGMVVDAQQVENMRAQIKDTIKQNGYDNIVNLAEFLSGEAINRETLVQSAQTNAIQAYSILKTATAALEDLAIKKNLMEQAREKLKSDLANAKDDNERKNLEAEIKRYTDLLNFGNEIGISIGGPNWFEKLTTKKTSLPESPDGRSSGGDYYA